VTLYEKSNVNVMHDIVPVAGILVGTFVMLGSPSLPAKTVPEFIANAKANPGKINMTSSGAGSLSHLAGELFKMDRHRRGPRALQGCGAGARGADGR